jgi:hypothetical protein
MEQSSASGTTAENVTRDRERDADGSLPTARHVVVAVSVVLIPLIILLVSTG